MLENVSIVLVNPSHPGNIGAVARAMKVMGITQLILVKPKVFPNPLADAMASGAVDVLQNARVCDSLSEAIEEAVLVIGTSARSRDVMIEPEPPELAVCRVKRAAKEGQVALVFGAERTGLTNDELRLCNGLVSIPTSDAYRSLNLAQAVQVLCYECFKVCQPTNDEADVLVPLEANKATRKEIEGLINHLETTMVAVEFLNQNSPRRLMNRLWRLFNRADLDAKEVNILRGFLTQVDKHVLTQKMSKKHQGERDDKSNLS
jgi:TrmH family RNA methyltransferase